MWSGRRRIEALRGRRAFGLVAGWAGPLLDAVGEGFGGQGGGRFRVGRRLGGGVVRDDDAVGFEVGDAVVARVAEHDGFAEHLEMAAGFVGEVAADGVVVVENEDVGGFALGAVDGVLEPAVEGGGRERCGGVGAGADGGDDHREFGDATRCGRAGLA